MAHLSLRTQASGYWPPPRWILASGYHFPPSSFHSPAPGFYFPASDLQFQHSDLHSPASDFQFQQSTIFLDDLEYILPSFSIQCSSFSEKCRKHGSIGKTNIKSRLWDFQSISFLIRFLFQFDFSLALFFDVNFATFRATWCRNIEFRIVLGAQLGPKRYPKSTIEGFTAFQRWLWIHILAVASNFLSVWFTSASI